MFMVCFWVYMYLSYTEIQQIWSYIDIEITYPERASCGLK